MPGQHTCMNIPINHKSLYQHVRSFLNTHQLQITNC